MIQYIYHVIQSLFQKFEHEIHTAGCWNHHIVVMMMGIIDIYIVVKTVKAEGNHQLNVVKDGWIAYCLGTRLHCESVVNLLHMYTATSTNK